MISPNPYIFNFSSLDHADDHLIGEKGIKIKQLQALDLNIPEGFIVTVAAYFKFSKIIWPKIKTILWQVDKNRPETFLTTQRLIEKIFMELELPPEFISELIKEYTIFAGILNHANFTIYPSYAKTDNYIKLNYTFKINSHGEANLIINLKKVWASLFSAEFLHSVIHQQLDPFNIGAAVIIQKNTPYELEGILYTKNPQTLNPKNICIAVNGSKHPSTHSSALDNSYAEVSKDDLLIHKRISDNKNNLSDIQLKKLAEIGLLLERNFYFTQYVRWAIKKNKIIILDCKVMDEYHDRQTEPTKNNIGENEAFRSPQNNHTYVLKTATKIYEHVTSLDENNGYTNNDSDGVGLVSGNLFLTDLKIHPKAVAKDRNWDNYSHRFIHNLEKIIKQNYKKPVIYCLSDLHTNELRNLSKGKLYEAEELNPIFGFHGLYRHLNDQTILNIELNAIKQLRNKYGYKNLWIMLPFSRNVSEIVELKKILTVHGLHRSSTFKIWLMFTNMINIIDADKFLDCGIDGVSINLDYLTTFLLAADKNNIEMAHVAKEIDDALIAICEKLIFQLNKNNLSSSVFGSALNHKREYLERFIKSGIHSITAAKDMITVTRNIVAKSERKMLQEK